MKQLILFFLVLSLSACGTTQSIKYSALEKVGIHKRDILVDRIKDTSVAQEKTKKQFKSAYQELSGLVNVHDNGLEKKYNKLKKAVENSEVRAEDLRTRIASVNEVANALFSEWQQELNEYQNVKLRNISANNLNTTKQRYSFIYQKMQESYEKVLPVLNVLQDNTLYLKHNLNARAVNGLSREVVSIENKVTELIRRMEISIDESTTFINEMESNNK